MYTIVPRNYYLLTVDQVYPALFNSSTKILPTITSNFISTRTALNLNVKSLIAITVSDKLYIFATLSYAYHLQHRHPQKFVQVRGGVNILKFILMIKTKILINICIYVTRNDARKRSVTTNKTWFIKNIVVVISLLDKV